MSREVYQEVEVGGRKSIVYRHYSEVGIFGCTGDTLEACRAECDRVLNLVAEKGLAGVIAEVEKSSTNFIEKIVDAFNKATKTVKEFKDVANTEGMKFYYFRDSAGDRKVTVAVKRNKEDSSKVDRGVAFCREGESFCKETGREIAVTRCKMVSAFKESDNVKINWDFQIAKHGLQDDADMRKIQTKYGYGVEPTEFENSLLKLDEAPKHESKKKESKKMNETVAEAIERIVLKLMNDKTMFTAFDVTNLLRKDGFRVNHVTVRDDIHAIVHQHMHGALNYVRSHVPVVGDTKAFVYCHMDDDARDYVAVKPQPSFNTANSVVNKVDDKIIYKSSAIGSASATMKTLVQPSSRSRYYISKAMLNAIGAKSGDMVGVNVNSQGKYACINRFNAATDNAKNYSRLVMVQNHGGLHIPMPELSGDVEVSIKGNDDTLYINEVA